MLDSMEQWYKEERKEKEASQNIFFNSSLLWRCHDAMREDLPSLHPLWATWEPNKSKPSSYPTDLPEITSGKTKLQATLAWIQKDFSYRSVLTMFSKQRWTRIKEMDVCFSGVWENMDEIESFVKWGYSRLEQLKTYLHTME
jgi:hypothetical protein